MESGHRRPRHPGSMYSTEAASTDARERLARIHASRAYRLILAPKNNPAYRLYARRRYGPGWRDLYA